ncbi:MAG TPA: ATP-binding cassette domain-containing protein [Thermoleophilia bacterium]
MLSIRNVTKRFDGIVAVDDLSFNIPEGCIFGFLGPNGAGKTTTMRMILDIIRPDSGTITWRGSPVSEEVRRRFGYLPEERGLYQKMKVGDELLFFARLLGLDSLTAGRKVGEWLERFGIDDRRNSRVEELSRGNQQKVQVITALIHEPELALLDEPFTALDPINAELLEEELRTIRDAGKTVVLSSHRMEQVEELCDNIAIISQGRLKLEGGVAEIRDRAVRRILNVRTASGRVKGVEDLPLVPLEGGRDYLRFSLRPDADPQAVLAALMEREQIQLFSLERPSMQEIFIAAVGDEDDEFDEAGAG